MAVVTARLKVKGKNFETDVNLDEALKFKVGKGDIMSAVVSPQIFYDLKKGLRASKNDLIDAFGTDEAYEVAKKIILSGEVQKNQEFRDSERDAKVKQVINLIMKNASDQHGRPYTEERLRRAIDEVHFVFDTKPADQQMPALVEKLKTVILIKIETKKIRLTIPAQFTGQVYGLLKDFKESEDWLANGSLQVIMNIPSGLQIDFYEKLNNIAHGTVQSQEIK